MIVEAATEHDNNDAASSPDSLSEDAMKVLVLPRIACALFVRTLRRQGMDGKATRDAAHSLGKEGKTSLEHVAFIRCREKSELEFIHF